MACEGNKAFARPTLLCLVLLSNCATTINDYKPAKIWAGEGVLVAHFEIIYNGKRKNDCEVVFESTRVKWVRVDKSGWVITTLPPGRARLKELICNDVSNYRYYFNQLRFKLHAYPVKTYLGHVKIYWQTPGGLKVAPLLSLENAIVDVESSDGMLSAIVKSRRSETKAYYRKRYEDPSRFKESLLDANKFVAGHSGDGAVDDTDDYESQ